MRQSEWVVVLSFIGILLTLGAVSYLHRPPHLERGPSFPKIIEVHVKGPGVKHPVVVQMEAGQSLKSVKDQFELVPGATLPKRRFSKNGQSIRIPLPKKV